MSMKIIMQLRTRMLIVNGLEYAPDKSPACAGNYMEILAQDINKTV